MEEAVLEEIVVVADLPAYCPRGVARRRFGRKRIVGEELLRAGAGDGRQEDEYRNDPVSQSAFS
jgi:hypothetical protein